MCNSYSQLLNEQKRERSRGKLREDKPEEEISRQRIRTQRDGSTQTGVLDCPTVYCTVSRQTLNYNEYLPGISGVCVSCSG